MNQNINVDLIPKFAVYGNLYFSQYDVGREAIINLVNGSTEYEIPSGATVTLVATKPSGLGFSVECTYNGNVVTVVSTETMTNEYGRFPCELRIENGDVLLGTTNFTFNVEKSPHPNGTVDGDSEEIINEIEALVLQSEGWAVGTQNGVPVSSDSPYYENNSKWWAEHPVGGGAGGQPTPVTLASQMTNTSVLYLYLGSETGYDYGYIYAYIGGAWTKTTLYGKGQDGANGQDGADGYSPTATVTQTATGATITVTDEDGTTTANIYNGSATDAQVETYVDAWLDEHPEATTTVQNGSIQREKISSELAKAINGLDDNIKAAYSYVNYTKATINNDGSLNTSGIGYTSDMLPVIPSETLVLNSKLTTKIGYYAADKSFLNLVSVSTGLNNYTVPSGAYYARYQNVYSNGTPSPLFVRRKTQPVNKSFADLIRSPLKAKPSIEFTGDSNTIGYGLASGEKSWANLLIDGLQSITDFRYGCRNDWVEVVGANSYSSGFDFMQYSEMSIWTDADSVGIAFVNNLSSAWKWFVDGVESGTVSSTSISLDGNLHKVTIAFTGGQAVTPEFVITKTITCNNAAVTGVGVSNVTVNSGKDWEIIMVGTNDRTKVFGTLEDKFYRYYGKGTYVVPFPNHKADGSYTHSQMDLFSSLIKCFEFAGYEIVNLAPENAFAFYDNTLFQSDGIHFNGKGHRIIANMVSGKMGLPLYLKDES